MSVEVDVWGEILAGLGWEDTKRTPEFIARQWEPCRACMAEGFDHRLKQWPNGHSHARPEQWFSTIDWRVKFARAGRGWGKTRTACEWMIDRRLKYPGTIGLEIMPTFDEARAIAFEGESGYLACLRGRGLVEDVDFTFNKSRLEIRLSNNSEINGMSAEVPKKLRGRQSHDLHFDEVATYPDQDKKAASDRGPFACWSNARFGQRLRLPDGSPNQVLITGTPKRVPFVRWLHDEIAANDGWDLVAGSSRDNLGNLSDTYREIIASYEGTALGVQELEGRLLDDVDGAFWQQSTIDESRVEHTPELIASLNRVVVAVDPAASDSPTADEVGIVGIGARDSQMFVLGDWSRGGMPNVWAHTVIDAVVEINADAIVMENNLVGGWMTNTLMQAMAERGVRCEVIGVRAGAGQTKAVRAEPVAMLYVGEVPRVHHVGFFAKLEDEMTTWVPGQTKRSPNRIDALVWGVLELMKLAPVSGAMGAGAQVAPVALSELLGVKAQRRW